MMKRFFLLYYAMFMLATFQMRAQKEAVNPFIGTSGDNGQLAPAALVPFGMVQVCPDSKPRQHAGYDFSVPQISGISINRLSGVGGSGCGGNLSILPGKNSDNVKIVKNHEIASPGYYSTLLNNNVEIKLTATMNMAVEQYIFPKDTPPILTFYPKSSFERVYAYECNIISDKEIGGYVSASNTCGNGKYTIYYYLHVNQSFNASQINDSYELAFCKNKPIEVRICISPISIEKAKESFLNNQQKSFNTLVGKAKQEWKNVLDKIEVEGGDKDSRTIFYTSLYRVYHSPFQVTTSEKNEYVGTDGKLYSATDFNYYSSWSLWDTYRTKFPLLTLMEPERSKDIAMSLLKLYETGKRDWSTQNECVPTVRTEHATSLLLDIYRKGINIANMRDVYPKMKEEAEKLSLKSPDQCLEAVSDFWALSEIAGIIGNTNDKIRFAQKKDSLFSIVWNREFKDINADYAKMRNNGLYQGTRWQYRWAVPQCLDYMIKVVGKEILCKQLSEFFDKNLYNQGNEPDIHVPYLFNRLGEPEKTQQLVSNMLSKEMIHRYGGNAEYKEPYIGKAFMNSEVGYCPEMDEDDGAMSAWYVFGAMGFYPLIVGEPFYELAVPLFDKIKLNLPNGKKFTITVKGRKSTEEHTLKRIVLNGKEFNSTQISHSDIIKGGELVYILTSIHSF